MIKTLHIENFRGFERLDVEDLGRVNLIIGKNDSGKTSLMAAAMVATSPTAIPAVAAHLVDGSPLNGDFDAYWRPLFRGVDVQRGFLIEITNPTGTKRATKVVGPKNKADPSLLNGAVILGASLKAAGTPFQIIPQNNLAVVIGDGDGPFKAHWTPSSVQSDGAMLDTYIAAYQAGKMPLLTAIVKALTPTIDAIDIVGAETYVKLEGYPLPMPMTVLGEGSRRLFQIAMPISLEPHLLAIDEIENGFHHSALPLVWKLLREAPLETQIFATTHREENIAAAAQAFVDAKDDGLRIIRIDKTPMGHRAVSYTAERALLALEDGLEIRG